MDAFTILAALVVFIIGLGLGATTQSSDFMEAMSNPKAVFVGLTSQYLFMPCMSLLLSKILNVSDMTAIGMILIGCSPGGTTSNVFTYWSKGNVALSITMTFFSTICAFFMLPLLIFLIIQQSFAQSVTIDYVSIVLSLLLVVIPCTMGVLLRMFNTETKVCDKFIWEWTALFTSVCGVIFLVGALISGLVINGSQIMSADWTIWMAGILLQPIGCLFGYFAGHLFGMNSKDNRTIALETGVQNFTLTIALINLTWANDTQKRNDIMLYPLVYGFLYIIHSFWIVGLLRYLAQDDVSEEVELLERGQKEKETEIITGSPAAVESVGMDGATAVSPVVAM